MLNHNIFRPRKRVWTRIDIIVLVEQLTQVKLGRNFKFCLRSRQEFRKLYDWSVNVVIGRFEFERSHDSICPRKHFEESLKELSVRSFSIPFFNSLLALMKVVALSEICCGFPRKKNETPYCHERPLF